MVKEVQVDYAVTEILGYPYVVLVNTDIDLSFRTFKEDAKKLIDDKFSGKKVLLIGNDLEKSMYYFGPSIPNEFDVFSHVKKLQYRSLPFSIPLHFSEE